MITIANVIAITRYDANAETEYFEYQPLDEAGERIQSLEVYTSPDSYQEPEAMAKWAKQQGFEEVRLTDQARRILSEEARWVAPGDYDTWPAVLTGAHLADCLVAAKLA